MTGPMVEERESAAPRSPEEKALARRHRRAAALAEAAGAGWKVWLVKIVLLGLIDALAVYGILVLFLQGQWIGAVIMAVVVVVLIVLVQLVQSIGDRLSRRLNKRLRHA